MKDDSMYNPVPILERCLDDAIEAWFPGENDRTSCAAVDIMQRLSVYMWPQTHDSTALGFPGVAGQAVTMAMTVAVLREVSSTYKRESLRVYHGGIFAYEADEPTKLFAKRFEKHNLPGQLEFEQQREAFVWPPTETPSKS